MKRGMRLRTLRADQEPEVTQRQMARQAGMNLTRYWQIENGEGPAPTPEEKKAVAAALGVKVSDIVWPEIAERASA